MKLRTRVPSLQIGTSDPEQVSIAVMLLTRIREVPCSNLGPSEVFLGFTQLLQEYRNSMLVLIELILLSKFFNCAFAIKTR
jgi:hypothetical protein